MKVDPVTGKTITVEADEEEEPAAAGPTAEELREKAQRELEEKKKRYDEARARILGAPSPSPGGSSGGRGSGGNSPRNGTPTPPYGEERGKGRGRGRGNADRRSDSRNGTRELFDPNYTPKPGSVTIQKGVKNGEGSRSGSGRSTPMQREEEQIIRPPRGPDATGKGFGFANRCGKTS
ncbi:SUZ domain-containing protein [Rutstroemia sp. NJR-2017a BVV2]|nr:SUZ domain-containing protein [Rutstroemia sp. NJR-2017a BVV2]